MAVLIDQQPSTHVKIWPVGALPVSIVVRLRSNAEIACLQGLLRTAAWSPGHASSTRDYEYCLTTRLLPDPCKPT